MRMTKKVDDRLKAMCNNCQSNLNKPCAWLSLGNEYCDEIMDIQNELQRYKKFVDDILNFYKHNRYEEELTEDNMFKFVLNQNEMIMTIEEFKGDDESE